MPSSAAPASSSAAAFTRGSTMRHIVVNTLYGAVGLMAIFLVDLADLYFISLLGQQELAAAVGYAAALLFFSTSLCIGFAIATTALVARAVGAHDMARARRLTAHAALFVFAGTGLAAGLLYLFVPDFLRLVGAEGEVLALAVPYMRIIVPSMPILGLAMAGGGVLRAVAKPKLAMASTVGGAAVNAALDPLFIFGLGLELQGAAIASVFARVGVLVIAAWGVIRIMNMMGRIDRTKLADDARSFVQIAAPAVATNLATPVGQAVLTKAISWHGPDAVAGLAIVSRLTPVAFGAVFSLSGAIGPIIGQNFGAQQPDRMRQALKDAALFCTLLVAGASVILLLLTEIIISGFQATDEAARLVRVFTHGVSFLFVFQGLLFTGNAAFNNLGRPLWSTGMNWGRATLGTLPFIWAGDALAGAPGILWGQAIGAMLFGLMSFSLALHLAGHAGALKGGGPAWMRLFRTPVQAGMSVFGYIPSRLRGLDRGGADKG